MLDGLEKTPKQIICHLERRERSWNFQCL